MNIELDGIALVKADQSPQGGQTEVRNVCNISTTDKRDMIAHKIPGMEGDVFQNLGRSPVIIAFDGTFQGKTAKENLEVLRTKFKQGTPLPFNSDVSGAADITQVMINDMRIEESARVMGRFHYSMVLQEYKVPPPEPVMPPAQDEEAAEWQEETAGEVMASINVLTGRVLDAEGNPKSGVTVTATGESGEYSVETDEEGMYRIEEVPPGTYTVKVDSEEYEGSEEEVTIEGTTTTAPAGSEETAEGGEETGEKETDSGIEQESREKGTGTGTAKTKEAKAEDKDKEKEKDTGTIESDQAEAEDKEKEKDTGTIESERAEAEDKEKEKDTGTIESDQAEAEDKEKEKEKDTGSIESEQAKAEDKEKDQEPSGDTRSKDRDKDKSKGSNKPKGRSKPSRDKK